MLANPQRQMNFGLRKLIAEENAISHLGEIAACYGKKVFIVGGTTALSKALEPMKQAFESAGIEYKVREYKGFCSKNGIDMLKAESTEWGPDLLVAVGGGSVMDTVKALGFWTRVPVVTVPTIVSTCAPWAPLSVMYTEEHFPDGGLDTYAPEYVVCDFNIIKENPKRFFAAGLGDSLAKLPELGTAVNPKPCYAAGVVLAGFIFENCLTLANQIDSKYGPTIEDMKYLSEVVDQAIKLTGLSSELTENAMGGSKYPLIAHGVDNALLCYSHKSHAFLHGERVSFGLVPHLLIRQAPQEQILEVMRFLETLDLPTHLENFGLDESDIPGLAQKIYDAPGISTTGVKIESIESALWEARKLPWSKAPQ